MSSNEEDFKAPKFKLVSKGKVSLSSLYPSRPYQASRKGVKSTLETIGVKVTTVNGKKVTSLLPEAVDLIASIFRDGWNRNDPVVTVPLTKASDSVALKRQRTDDSHEFKTIEIWKGLEGTYPNPSGKGEPVKLTHEMIRDEWELTFPETVEVKGKNGKKATINRFDWVEFVAILAANRAVTVVVLLYNAACRASGNEGLIVTEIERECRDYGTEETRDKASIYLNEAGDLGKLAPSKLQRLGAAFDQVERGGTEASLAAVFAATGKQRGDMQAHYKVPACLAFLKRLGKNQTVTIDGKNLLGNDAYITMKDLILSGVVTKPTVQGNNLKSLTRIFNIVTHSDGLEEQFSKAGGPTDADKRRPAYGVRKATQLNAVATVDRIREHPELAQMVADYFAAKRDPKWADPLLGGEAAPVKSMASTEITTAAAEVEKGIIQSLLMTAAGNDTGHALMDLVKAAGKLVEPVFFVDAEGQRQGEAVTQADMDAFCIRLHGLEAKPKAKKKA